jgi:hypothetical protein
MSARSVTKTPAEANTHEWRHVPVGACIRLKSGIWHVVEREGDVITMRNPKNNHVTTGSPPPGSMVTVLHPGDPLYVAPADEAAAQARIAGLSESAAAGLASALVQIHLGTYVVGERDLDRPGDPMRCPPVEPMPPSHLVAHLILFHRLDDGDPVNATNPGDPAMLLALHASRVASAEHVHTGCVSPSTPQG